jgi:hypothetical protein
MKYVFAGGEDSDAGEEVPERAARVHVAARPQRETRAGAAAQAGSAQGWCSELITPHYLTPLPFTIAFTVT